MGESAKRRPPSAAAVAAMAMLAPLVVGGILTALAVGRSAFGRRRASHRDLPLPGSPDSVRAAIVGRSKAVVASRLGPPRTASVTRVTAAGDRPLFFQADTWYYPFNVAHRSAIAIQFEDDVAREVEFLSLMGE